MESTKLFAVKKQRYTLQDRKWRKAGIFKHALNVEPMNVHIHSFQLLRLLFLLFYDHSEFLKNICQHLSLDDKASAVM